jgi:tRNA pseudouridine13 synthase
MKVLQVTSCSRPLSAHLVAGLRWKVRIAGGNRNGGYQLGRAILDRLRHVGLPCYFPRSDFGRDGELLRWGRMMLAGRRLPGQAAGADPGRSLRAAQSWLFNRHLARRIDDGLLDKCLDGDVLQGNDGRQALCSDQPQGQRRMQAWEAVPLGPLFGDGMSAAAGEARQREDATLAAAGLDASAVRRLHGGRRILRVQPRGILDPLGDDLDLSAELPPDCYLDVLLDELIKPEQQPEAEEEP